MLVNRRLNRNNTRRKCRNVNEDLLQQSNITKFYFNVNKINNIISNAKLDREDKYHLEKLIFTSINEIITIICNFKKQEISTLKDNIQELNTNYKDLAVKCDRYMSS